MRKMRTVRPACACASIIWPSALLSCILVSNDSVSGHWRPWSDSQMLRLILVFAVRICPKTHIASRKHAYIILTPPPPPQIPLLYSKTGVYRGIYYFSYFAKKHRCGYSLEPHRQGGSNEYLQSMFWAEIWKISEILSENFQVLVVKFSIYLFVFRFYLTTRLLGRLSPLSG